MSAYVFKQGSQDNSVDSFASPITNFVSPTLAHVDEPGVWPCEVQDTRLDQVVVDDHVGLAEDLHRPAGNQARISGASPDSSLSIITIPGWRS